MLNNLPDKQIMFSDEVITVASLVFFPGHTSLAPGSSGRNVQRHLHSGDTLDLKIVGNIFFYKYTSQQSIYNKVFRHFNEEYYIFKCCLSLARI